MISDALEQATGNTTIVAVPPWNRNLDVFQWNTELQRVCKTLREKNIILDVSKCNSSGEYYPISVDLTDEVKKILRDSTIEFVLERRRKNVY